MEDLIKSVQTIFESNVQGIWIVLTYIIISYGVSAVLKTFLYRYIQPRANTLIKSWLSPIGDLLQFVLLLTAIVLGSKAAGVDITILLAIAGILTAAVSLSLDNSFKDGLAAIKLLSYDAYRIGEQVTFDSMTGEITGFTLFTTTLYIPSRGIVSIGNSKVNDGVIENHSRVPVQVAVRIPILNVDNRTTIIKFIKAKLKDNDKIVSDSVKVLHAFEPGGSEIFTLQFKVHSYKDRLQIQSDVSVFISDLLEEVHYKLGEVSLIQHIGN